MKQGVSSLFIKGIILVSNEVLMSADLSTGLARCLMVFHLDFPKRTILSLILLFLGKLFKDEPPFSISFFHLIDSY